MDTPILDHGFLHVRCCTHILSLIVTEGLKKIDLLIVRVQNIGKLLRIYFMQNIHCT